MPHSSCFKVGGSSLIPLVTFQFRSVTQLCPTLCDCMDCSTPGFPVHHQLLEFAQTHVHWVGDAIQLSHPLLSPSPPTFNLFQHQGLYIRRRQWQPTPVLLPGKSHGRRSLVGCSLRGRSELDMTEWLPFHFSISCIGEGNGNPLQCFCLENPRDRRAWWAAIYGVAQSQTQLKWLSSGSSSLHQEA